MNVNGRRRTMRWLALTLIVFSFCAGFAADRKASESARGNMLLVGYFPQWGVYNEPQYFLKNLVSNGGAALLDQLNYAQGAVGGERCSLADANADLDYTFDEKTSVDGHADNPVSPFGGNFHQLEELKQKYPKVKILISLEGSASYFSVDAQPEKRAAFVASCVDLFLKGNFAPGITKPGLFDGFDVDWEYPKAGDAANYVALLEEFRRQMDAYRRGLRLTVAVGPSPHRYPEVDMAAVGRTVDEVGVMNYDYAGPWSRTTGMIAPLYADKADPRAGGSVDASLTQYRAAGIPPTKLLMGLPFYGYGWRHVAPRHHGLFQPGQAISGDEPYAYVRGQMKHSTVHRDPVNQAPWLFNGKEFWTYEDARSIAYKIDYARRHGLGGVMIWELSGDSPGASLLKAAHQGLVHPMNAARLPVAASGAGINAIH